MGYILYKLSNLHTWEQRLRERGVVRIHNCEAREKDRNRRVQGEGTAVYQSSHREKLGKFHLERYL